MWFNKKKRQFQRFPSFRFCPVLEIENLKTTESFRLLQTFIVLVVLSMEKIKTRSRYPRCSVRKDVLRNFAKFTGRYLCQSLSKKKLWHRCFPVNFLRIHFLQSTSGRLFCETFH